MGRGYNFGGQMRTSLIWCLAAALGLFVEYGMADTGFEGATRIEKGSYSQTRSITMANNAPTVIAAASVKRPDILCFNNSAYTLWLSTGAAGTTAVNMGVPVLSSATFNLGAFTGPVSGTLDASGVGDVRCWDGLVQ